MGRRYAHAPIVEAILELQVVNPEDMTIGELAQMDVGEDYAEATPIFNVEGQFEWVDGAMSGRARGDQVGLAFHRLDNLRVVQAGLDRFAFVWRGQYDRWDKFLDEAEALWLRYRDVAKPSLVRTVGVRFVNRIRMTKPSVEIKDYLRTSIEISPYLPQAVNGLFMQVDIPLQRLDATATITSAMLTDDAADEPGIALLLDIDVKGGLNLETTNAEFEPSLRATLDRLRLAKNYVFEACITDATRGLID